MKKFYFLFVVLFVVGSVNAQVIYIQDANFKAKLLQADVTNTIAKNIQGDYFKIDANNNNEIEQSEALEVSYLKVDSSSLTSLVGITYFINIKELFCRSNSLSSMYVVSQLINLEKLDCSNNTIGSLYLTGLTNLKYLSCNSCGLTSLDVAGFTNLTYLACDWNNISNLDLTGLSELVLLTCSDNQLESLNVSMLTNLKKLSFYNNQINTIDLTGLTELDLLACFSNQLTALSLTSQTNLIWLYCNDNSLTSLNFPPLSPLQSIFCANNNLTTLDLSSFPNLEYLSANDNQLVSIFMKNGSLEDLSSADLSNNPNLQYICADEDQIQSIGSLISSLGYNCEINSYCSFTLGGTFYTINGNNTFDNNSNGCEVSDTVYSNLKFNITNGAQTGSLISNQSGNYSIPVKEGVYTITPILENPTYFNISPPTVEVAFPDTTSPFVQNFCITPNGLHQDVDVNMIPLNPAIPGFDANYKIIYRNLGNVSIAMGTVALNYNDAVLDFVSASPDTETLPVGSLFWTFENLQPFENRTINLTFNLNSPTETPALNGNDILSFEASSDTSVGEDDSPDDNTLNLQQTVVNSFDPNDKTCLEGTSITPDMIGKYVHYMIRFENTGTFAAQNIVVKDMIDTAKFDVSSLVALNGSHPYTTRITGNKVEFIFENINLPFDDANNEGYVVFKIKTLPTLALGDSFSNSASIYFDYNFPIVTDPAVTTFAVLGNEDFVFNNYFALYPNPTDGILNISTKQAVEVQSITIYNTLGQLVVSVPNALGVNNVDVSSLATGSYFIKIVSDKGTSNSKFIKQ